MLRCLKSLNHYKWNKKRKISKITTYCKVGEDVCSCPDTNANHTVDPADKPAVSEGPETNGKFMDVITDPSLIFIYFKMGVTYLSWVNTEGSISANSSMVG